MSETCPQENLTVSMNIIEDFVFVLDKNGNVIQANKAAEKSLGYSIEELTKMNVIDLHPESETETVNCIFKKMLEGTLSYCTVPLQTKDKMLILVETRISKCMWEGKEAIFGISRDITKRMQMQDRLKNIAESLQFVIDATNVGVWDWNVQTGKVFFNERWAEIVGYSLDELEPTDIQTWMKLTHPNDLNKSLKLLEAHFKGDVEFYDCDIRMMHKDGNWVWIHDCGKVVEWDSDGTPLRMIGTHEDITTRKELEIQKSEYQDQLEHLVQERTKKLKKSNDKLHVEIKKREETEKRLLQNIKIKEATRIISSILSDFEDFDEAIEDFLLVLGHLTDASRASLFLFRDDDKIIDNTHEWCAGGVKPQKENLQELPSHTFSWFMEKLGENKTIHINNLDSLPMEASSEQDILNI